MTNFKGKAQIFPYIILDTEQKEHTVTLVNNKAGVSVHPGEPHV